MFLIPTVLCRFWTRFYHFTADGLLHVWYFGIPISANARCYDKHTFQDYIRTARAKGLDEKRYYGNMFLKFITAHHHPICKCISIGH